MVVTCRYADAVLSDTEDFQEKLTKEMKDCADKHFDDESVPEVSTLMCLQLNIYLLF